MKLTKLSADREKRLRRSSRFELNKTDKKDKDKKEDTTNLSINRNNRIIKRIIKINIRNENLLRMVLLNE